jgi:hypothetical protein
MRILELMLQEEVQHKLLLSFLVVMAVQETEIIVLLVVLVVVEEAALLTVQTLEQALFLMELLEEQALPG